MILALAFLLSTHAAPRTSSSHSGGPNLSHGIRELNNIQHSRKLLAVKATVADVDDNVADVGGPDPDVSIAERAPAKNELETNQPESASAPKIHEVTMGDVLVSDNESSLKEDIFANDQPQEPSPAEISADKASSTADESSRDAEQQGSSELSGGDLGYGPELQAFDDVTEPNDRIAEGAEDAAEDAEEEDTDDYSSGGVSEGIGRIEDDDDDDVEWEEDLDFMVKSDDEAASEKDERRAGATAEAAGGMAEGGGLAEEAEQGGLTVTSTDDMNKRPEPQVFDDVNEPEANNADKADAATVAGGNNEGSNVEFSEETKEKASSVGDNKEGDEGLKEIIAFDARTLRNPISMVLEEDIESANKGTEEVQEIEGEGKEESDEKEGHRRVLWMLENAMETEMEEA
ncbi:unnamed protein product [Closterium sp. Yama58-4]|nr:unnamed protein product [Closterium sp. Yama58-4]